MYEASLFGLPALGIVCLSFASSIYVLILPGTIRLLAAPVNLMDAYRVSKTYTLTRPALGGLMRCALQVLIQS